MAVRRSPVAWLIGAAVIALVSFAIARAFVQSGSSPSLTVILRNGMVVDGTGGPAYKADIGISGGVIARIGDLSNARAAVNLDAAGLFVVPGFINLHSHAVLDELPRAENLLTQGVTTVVLVSDGIGPFDIAALMSLLDSRQLALNAGAYVGFNSVWQSVMRMQDRRPTTEEIDRMRELIVRGLEHGAWGVSAGLAYAPGYYAKTDEVIRIVEAARNWRTNLPNHERVTPESNFSGETGIMETMAIADAAGLLPVVTHLKSAAVLEAMASPHKRGPRAAADAYPYLAGHGRLDALLVPRWAQEGGRMQMLTRFADPTLRARIAAEIEQMLDANFGGAQGVYLPASKEELADVVRAGGVSAGEAIVRILEKGAAVRAILRFGSESDLAKILRHPTTSIACDCDAATSAFHPRYYGTFPRVLGRYVREQKVLTWEDAIRKMTALPASTIGMVDRGVLAVGMAADVTVFDANTVIDRATYENPTKVSEGIRHVIVNGKVALRDGQVTGEQAGRALRRTLHMPSRGMSVQGSGLSVRKGTVGAESAQGPRGADHQLELDVRQKAGARKAEGALRFVDLRTKTTIQSTELGMLQTVDGWASFTGRARVSSSPEELFFTAIVERSDPVVADKASVTIHVEGYSRKSFVDAGNVEIATGVR